MRCSVSTLLLTIALASTLAWSLPVQNDASVLSRDTEDDGVQRREPMAPLPDPASVISNGQTQVTGQDVIDAVQESNRHDVAGTKASANPNRSGRVRKYPGNFNNYPNGGASTPGTNPNLNYGGSGANGAPLDMQGKGKEFPVLNGQTYTGGSQQQGTFRAITQNGQFKGIVSHDPTKGRNDPNKNDHYEVPYVPQAPPPPPPGHPAAVSKPAPKPKDPSLAKPEGFVPEKHTKSPLLPASSNGKSFSDQVKDGAKAMNEKHAKAASEKQASSKSPTSEKHASSKSPPSAPKRKPSTPPPSPPTTKKLKSG